MSYNEMGKRNKWLRGPIAAAKAKTLGISQSDVIRQWDNELLIEAQEKKNNPAWEPPAEGYFDASLKRKREELERKAEKLNTDLEKELFWLTEELKDIESAVKLSQGELDEAQNKLEKLRSKKGFFGPSKKAIAEAEEEVELAQCALDLFVDEESCRASGHPTLAQVKAVQAELQEKVDAMKNEEGS